jgi:hypothetical protein
MIQVHRGLLMLIAIPLLLAAHPQSAGQSSNNPGPNTAVPHLDGVWVLSLDQGQGNLDTDVWTKKVVLFKSVGSDIKVSDPETETTWTGKAYDAGKFSFTLPAKTGSSGNPKTIVLNGSVSGNTIRGVTKIQGMDVNWRAVKLPSAWECSNHKNPTHVATSEDEMRTLTKQYMCAGWHKVPII